MAGSDASKESLTQTGTFTVSSPDGIKSLTIDGHTVISNGVFTATSFTTSTLGNTLSVTGYNAATGVVSYSYTLLDNETHAAGAGTNSLFENLAVVLTDQDNQTANDTLVGQHHRRRSDGGGPRPCSAAECCWNLHFHLPSTMTLRFPTTTARMGELSCSYHL